MKILIIGGAGFVGANLVRRCLKEDGVEVTVLDALTPLSNATLRNLEPVMDRISFVHGDMGDEAILRARVGEASLIFNCAAQASHPLSLKHPMLDMETNVVGNLKLLEAIRQVNPEAVVVYPSSSTAVGKARGVVVDEDHPERPLELYSAHKGLVEKYYGIYHHVHGLKTVCIRFANLFGAYGNGHPQFGFMNYFIARAWAGETLTVFGDGAQKRNVMYIDDAVDLMLRATREPDLFGALYIASGDEHVSVLEIAETMVEVFERGRVERVDWPEEWERIEVDSVTISSARLREKIGWKPSFTFRTGLEETRRILEQ
ncbi:MAG: NAD-dependent epimerase/dehydratase family protein [Verrucomicrobiota bacterium]